MLTNRLTLAVSIVAATIVLVTAVVARSNVTGAPATPGIVGSWIFIPTGSALRRSPGAPSLVTFTADGNVLWSGPRAATSGGHGAWSGTGRTVTETFVFNRRNESGDFTGTQKVRLNLTLDAYSNEISGTGKTDLYDPQGAVVESSDITTHATRIRVESP